MRARSLLILSIVLVSGLATAAPSTAQSSLPQLESIEVTEPLHASLVLLQEYWLEWLTAYHQRDEERAAEVLVDIVTTMRDLHVERLSDMAFGAAVSGVQAARASDFDRAAWALEAAELLDSRRPETSFAAATVARLEGRRLAALKHQVEGYFRLLWFPWERAIFAEDIILWALFILTLSGALFVVLLASTKGGRLYQDMVALLSRRLPEGPARVASVVLMLLPLALPNGLLWLLVVWSIAFWGYSTRSERAVLIVAWLLLGIAPEIVSAQRRRMAVRMSSPVRVMESLAQSRLDGSTLTDLGNLRTLLPESVAVKHLLADVHRRLGQWEFARSLYLDVIDAEPDNAEATVDLGAFYFRVGDYAGAIQHFQRASAKDSVAAAAHFNLSQSYSASYLFSQSEQALRTAGQLDEDGVSRWVSEAESERVVTVDGGVERLDEIDGELRAAWNPTEEPQMFFVRLLTSGTVRLALLAGFLAVGVNWVARRAGFYTNQPFRAPEGATDEAEGEGSLAEVLIPGLTEARSERGFRTLRSLWLPVALLTLPLVTLLGYRVPWGYDPGGSLMWAVAGIGLLAYMSHRVIRGLRA